MKRLNDFRWLNVCWTFYIIAIYIQDLVQKVTLVMFLTQLIRPNHRGSLFLQIATFSPLVLTKKATFILCYDILPPEVFCLLFNKTFLWQSFKKASTFTQFHMSFNSYSSQSSSNISIHDSAVVSDKSNDYSGICFSCIPFLTSIFQVIIQIS